MKISVIKGNLNSLFSTTVVAQFNTNLYELFLFLGRSKEPPEAHLKHTHRDTHKMRN